MPFVTSGVDLRAEPAMGYTSMHIDMLNKGKKSLDTYYLQGSLLDLVRAWYPRRAAFQPLIATEEEGLPLNSHGLQNGICILSHQMCFLCAGG